MSTSSVSSSSPSGALFAPLARFALLAALSLALTAHAEALDCRKFSFAPACRGIMLKRVDPAVAESSQKTHLEDLQFVHAHCENPADVLNTLLKYATRLGFHDAVPLSFLSDAAAMAVREQYYINFGWHLAKMAAEEAAAMEAPKEK